MVIPQTPTAPPQLELRLRGWDLFFAGLSLGAIVIHDAAHLRAGRFYDVFWICNVAGWFPAIALLTRSKLFATIGLTWLVPGTAIWVLDVAFAGAEILPTSYGVHIGGALVAGWSVARLGRSPPALWAAFALVAICFVGSLLFLPAAANVNAAHSVPRGWTFLGESRFAFVLALALFSLLVVIVGQITSAAIARAGRAVRS